MVGAAAAPSVRDPSLVVEVAVDGVQSSVAVHGEIDIATSPLLDRIAAALVDHGYARIVIDASGIGFMDCAGLRVLLAAADRLRRHGGDLVIGSPSPQVVRLLNVTRADAVLHVQPHPSATAERRDGTLTGALERVVAMRSGTDMIEATLGALVVLAAATITAADAVSLTLLQRGQPITAAACGDTAVVLDQYQYDTGQGPCVDASTHGQPFHVESVEDEPRWPAFIPHLVEYGVRSILSTPLVTAGGPVGALNLYARGTATFDVDAQELAAVFAGQASTVVSHAAEVSVEQTAKRVQAALVAREVIAKAQGVLMAQTGASADEAHTELRKRSQSTNSPLVDQAGQVIAGIEGRTDV